MNTLIDPVKRIARDLVDKKLWPVAVLLLAALVAVPVLIGGASADEAPAPAALAAAAPEGPASKSLVTVIDESATGNVTRPGRLDDPFYDPPEPPAEDTPAAAAPADASPSNEGGTSSSTGTPPSTGTPGGAPSATPTPSDDPPAAGGYYRTEVRWYKHKLAKTRPLSRLTPLGGLADTAALYLGVTKASGTYAVFLLGVHATSKGDAKCEDSDCRVIGLKSGETQRITVASPEGGEAREYVLEVRSVRRAETDAATARAMRHRVHPDGRDVMRAMWSDSATAAALGPIQFDYDSGLLVKSAGAAKASK